MTESSKQASAAAEKHDWEVCSYNGWDPLEEVIVGRIEGAFVPAWHAALRATMPGDQQDFFRKSDGQPFPADRIAAAAEELEGLCERLRSEGVTVRRPEVRDHSRGFATPDWSAENALYAAMPRDVMLVVGDEIIEAPMAWRSRYFEINAYRTLIREYFRHGARWTAAPKPELKDGFYRESFDAAPDDPSNPQYVIGEAEPTFDAADFVRCGRDLFVQMSHVTNRFGIDWLDRHLGDDYTIHEVRFHDAHPMHIDATLVPLAPGKLLINPERVLELPEKFRGWDVFEAPKPAVRPNHVLYMSSSWLSMNTLMLDEKRVLVEQDEAPLREAFARWGFEAIPVKLSNFNAFGGSFHCATIDVRRRGGLESYF
jgi:glycine amidinotransferase